MRKHIYEQLLFFRENPYGFGYEIVRTVKEDDKHGPHYRPQVLLYTTSSKKQIEAIYEGMVAGTLTEADWPEPETEFTPKVLIVEEKHGTYHQLIQSQKGYYEALVALIKLRDKQGWYYDEVPSLTEKLGELMSYSDEQIEALPRGLQAEARKQTEHYQKLQRELADAKEKNYLLKSALKGDGPTAAEFLREYENHEYNRVRLEPFESIYP